MTTPPPASDNETPEQQQATAASFADDPVLDALREAISRPAASILTALSLLGVDTLSDEQRRLVGLMRSAGQSLQSTVHDLDDIIGVLRGDLDLEVVDVDPGAVVRASVQLREERIKAEGTTVDVRVAPDVPRNACLASRALERVAGALLDHALVRAPEGKIVMELEHDAGAGGSGAIRLRVSWLPKRPVLAEELPPPHALGLAVAERVVADAGGAIGTSSRSGEGVWARLPLFRAADPAHPGGREPRPLRILVVEDDPFSRMMAELQVELSGHVPVPAHDGDEAMRHIDHGDIDLVLMDRNLGAETGIEITARIRARDDEAASMPVVALSASNLDEDRLECLGAGMDDYLTKPLMSAALGQAIAALIAAGRMPDRRAEAGGGARARSTRALARDDHAREVELEVIAHLTELAEELGSPDTVRQICERFLRELPNRLGLLAVSALRRDRDEFRKVAHRFRGAASVVGGSVLMTALDASSEVTDLQDLPRVAEAVRKSAMLVRSALHTYLEDVSATADEV